ncbi:MAG: thiamine phosphate synthase [Candidatus Omnitrophota bacterium]
MRTIDDRNLYLVITEKYGMGRSALVIAERALAGGVDIIQMREKERPAAELLKTATDMVAACKKKKALFIVNDDPALAARAGADGVHLGQEDTKRFSIRSTREIVGRDSIIGVSTHSLDQFAEANEADVDYVAFGPVFPTKTKDYFIGTADISEVLKIAEKPVFFIGGINLSNIDELLTRGARNIALIRGITEADDIEASARQYKELMGRC